MRTTVSLDSISALVEGRHANPFDVLGPHEVQDGTRSARAVRAYLPNSQQVWLIDEAHNTSRPMRRIHPAGLYEAVEQVAEDNSAQPYQLRVTHRSGQTLTMHDPYAFEPFLTDYDLYLLGEGTHSRAYHKLGAQLRTVDDVTGVNFAVWAPNATSVQVVADFNYWDGRSHGMRKHIPSGIWELFIPGLKAGEKYKFRIKRSDGGSIDKSDPYGFAAELPPCTASIVTDLDRHQWRDGEWMEQRRRSKRCSNRCRSTRFTWAAGGVARIGFTAG